MPWTSISHNFIFRDATNDRSESTGISFMCYTGDTICKPLVMHEAHKTHIAMKGFRIHTPVAFVGAEGYFIAR